MITSEQINGVTVIRVGGNGIAMYSNAKEIQAAVDNTHDDYVVIDITGVQAIDSSSLGAILRASQKKRVHLMVEADSYMSQSIRLMHGEKFMEVEEVTLDNQRRIQGVS